MASFQSHGFRREETDSFNGLWGCLWSASYEREGRMFFLWLVSQDASWTAPRRFVKTWRLTAWDQRVRDVKVCCGLIPFTVCLPCYQPLHTSLTFPLKPLAKMEEPCSSSFFVLYQLLAVLFIGIPVVCSEPNQSVGQKIHVTEILPIKQIFLCRRCFFLCCPIMTGGLNFGEIK